MKNVVEYKYYEKPMSSNVCVQKMSAMEENAKMKTLANDLTRRLLNTCELMGNGVRVGIVDEYSKKLLTSGYRLDQVRKIILNGIKAYERKLKESKMPGGRKLHRNAGESSGKRCRKKLLDKSEWFKSKKKSEEQEEQNTEQSRTKSRARKMCRKDCRVELSNLELV